MGNLSTVRLDGIFRRIALERGCRRLTETRSFAVRKYAACAVGRRDVWCTWRPHANTGSWCNFDACRKVCRPDRSLHFGTGPRISPVDNLSRAIPDTAGRTGRDALGCNAGRFIVQAGIVAAGRIARDQRPRGSLAPDQARLAHVPRNSPRHSVNSAEPRATSGDQRPCVAGARQTRRGSRPNRSSPRRRSTG